MALDLASKAAIRRHLGLPAAGIGVQGQTFGNRAMFQGVSQLEQYMIALQLEEESIIRGVPYGALLVQAGNQVGDVLTVTINSTPYVYTVTSDDLTIKNVDSAPGRIATKIARLINQTPVGGILVAAGCIANPVVPTYNLPTANQISCLSVGGATFTLAVSGPCLILMQNGHTYPDPQLTVDDGNGDPSAAIVAYGLLPVCNYLERAMLNSSSNLSFSNVGAATTGQVTFRADEVQARSALLQNYRRELGTMLSYYAFKGPQSPGGGKIIV